MHHKKKQASYRAAKRQAKVLATQLADAQAQVADAQDQVTKAEQEATHLYGRAYRAETALRTGAATKLPPEYLQLLLNHMVKHLGHKLAETVIAKQSDRLSVVAHKACIALADALYNASNFYAGDRPLEELIKLYLREDLQTGDIQVDLELEGRLHRRVDRKEITLFRDSRKQYATEVYRSSRRVYPLTGTKEGYDEVVSA